MIRFANNSGRVTRIVRLVILLQGGTAWTADELMDALSVSRRTFYRDLKCLNEAGVAVSFHDGIGYTLNGRVGIDQCSLETAEVLGLMFLSKLAKNNPGQPMMDHALMAIYKLISAAHPAIRAAGNDIMSCISIHTHVAPTTTTANNHFLALLRIIDAAHTCTVCKAGANRDDYELICFRPLGLELFDNGWSVCGETQPDGSPLKILLTEIIEIDNESLMCAAS